MAEVTLVKLQVLKQNIAEAEMVSGTKVKSFSEKQFKNMAEKTSDMKY